MTEVTAVALAKVMVALLVKLPFRARVVASPVKELLLVNIPSILNVAVPVPVVHQLLQRRPVKKVPSPSQL